MHLSGGGTLGGQLSFPCGGFSCLLRLMVFICSSSRDPFPESPIHSLVTYLVLR